MKVIFFGDIVGRAARAAVARILPTWQKTYQPDAIIGNVENLAHGKGVSQGTLDELLTLGFTAFTSGDHVLNRPEADVLLQNPYYPLIRPANFPDNTAGRGSMRISVGSRELLVINLIGQVFIEGDFSSPFSVVDKIIADETAKGEVSGIIVDLHAEATSEKVAMGWYLDGRATAVLGTHTHVPTCDAWILPKGTAYVSDVGMTGVRESVIGVKTEQSLSRFLTGERTHFEPAEVGTVQVTAMLVTFDPGNRRATSIERLTEYVTAG